MIDAHQTSLEPIRIVDGGGTLPGSITVCGVWNMPIVLG